jgi:signal peptidase I
VDPAGQVVSAPSSERSVRPRDLDAHTRAELRSGDGAVVHRKRSFAALAEMWGLVLVALLLAFLIKTFLVQAFYIPSGSMIPTLEVGDRVLVEKISYRLRQPERGEVIVFQRPGSEGARAGFSGQVRSFLEGLGLAQPDADIDLIKRVIGLPGERVKVRKGVVTINGKPLREPYAQPESRSFPATVVPAGELFMMGDNRMNSQDSRFDELGTIPMRNVVGRAFVILWPPSQATARIDRDYPRVGEDPLRRTGGADGRAP